MQRLNFHIQTKFTNLVLQIINIRIMKKTLTLFGAIRMLAGLRSKPVPTSDSCPPAMERGERNPRTSCSRKHRYQPSR